MSYLTQNTHSSFSEEVVLASLATFPLPPVLGAVSVLGHPRKTSISRGKYLALKQITRGSLQDISLQSGRMQGVPRWKIVQV